MSALDICEQLSSHPSIYPILFTARIIRAGAFPGINCGEKAGKQSAQVTRPSQRQQVLRVSVFGRDSLAQIRIHRTNRTNSLGVFFFFCNLFWNQNKGFPGSNGFLTSSAQQKDASSSPYLRGRCSLFWTRWWESLTTSKTCGAFLQPER